MNGSRNQSNNKDLDKNIDFHFLDLTVTFYAFDFNSYDCSPDEVNGGYRVVPEAKTNPFMYDTLWLVIIKVLIKWPKV